jgi:hypothetical protein
VITAEFRSWSPIRYRGFYDYPLVFLVDHKDDHFLFECLFDEERDEYADDYRVYRMPVLRDEELPTDWTNLRETAIAYVGTVPVREVRFDHSRRKEIETSFLDRFSHSLGDRQH